MRYGPPNSFEDASILALIYPPSSTSYYNYSSPISSPIISYENHHSNRSEPTEFDNLFYQEELDLSRDEWNTNEYPSSNQQEIPVDQDSRAEIEALYLSTDSEESPASDRMPRTQEQAQTYVQSVAVSQSLDCKFSLKVENRKSVTVSILLIDARIEVQRAGTVYCEAESVAAASRMVSRCSLLEVSTKFLQFSLFLSLKVVKNGSIEYFESILSISGN